MQRCSKYHINYLKYHSIPLKGLCQQKIVFFFLVFFRRFFRSEWKCSTYRDSFNSSYSAAAEYITSSKRLIDQSTLHTIHIVCIACNATITPLPTCTTRVRNDLSINRHFLQFHSVFYEI